MNLIWVIRELCSGEKGFENLFDKEKSYTKLIELSDDKKDAAQFATLLYGRARTALIELILDAYNYKTYAETVKSELMSDGLSTADAVKILEIFFRAFGFPDYRDMDKSRVAILLDGDDRFRTEYVGEAVDGREHGIGVRTCYYNGKWCSHDECVWIDGEMTGFDNAKEMEFEVFEDRKMGFVVNNNFVGRFKCIFSDGTESYEDGVKLNIR